MAISVNEVYQTVLAVANKEQRGYVTPQEFNLFAEQAQMDIFQQYFYDLNQFRRDPGNNTIIGDVDNIVEEKIDVFTRTVSASVDATTGVIGLQSSNLYKLYSIVLNYTGGSGVTTYTISTHANQCSIKDYSQYSKSPLTRPTMETPMYYLVGSGGAVGIDYAIFSKPTIDELSNIKNPPTGISANITYIAKPKKPNWTYIIVNNKPLYNSSATDHRDFQLHVSEKSLLVKKILQLTGISTKDFDVTQFALQDEVKTIQQQKS